MSDSSGSDASAQDFEVTGDVIARKLFNASIGGADELSGYAFCAGTALALSFALFERAHIRVDFLYHLFPRRMQRATDILGLILMLGFALVVTAMIYKIPDGDQWIKGMTTTERGRRLGNNISRWQRDDFNKKTGRLYTVDQLLPELTKIVEIPQTTTKNQFTREASVENR